MFKRKILFLTLPLFLYGGLLDFQVLDKAKTSYDEEKYDESAKLYSTLETKDDAVHYNLGNAYYKEKAYDKAIAEFKQVNTPELKAKALHNLGNAYAQSKKVDEAIASYEEALKLNEDEDTKFNLELLKKQKQEQEKKKDQNKKDDQNKDDQKKDQQDKDQKDQKKNDQQKKDDQKKSKDQKKGDDQKDKNDQQKSKDQKSDEEKKKEDQEKEKKAQEKKDKEKKEKEEKMNAEEAKAQEQPISDMQERKYEKMLDKRGIKTLMVPLKTEGGRDEETTAW